MNAKRDETIDSLDCKVLVETAKGQVAITRKLLPSFEQLADQKRARLEAVMRRWCDGVPLTAEMFNGNEGRTTAGILLQAFKGFKIRFYGFARQVASVRTFLIVDVDPAKKQDKADPKILSRAKSRADSVGKV